MYLLIGYCDKEPSYHFIRLVRSLGDNRCQLSSHYQMFNVRWYLNWSV
jgi:hypothetical protein